MTRPAFGKALLGLSIAGTVAIVAIADVFNATHLFNPAWSGHARFHIGMQFTTLVLVSIVSLAALRRGNSREALIVAAVAPASFWPGLFIAWAIPGTDVYASEALRALGVPINLVLAALFMALTFIGYRLARHQPPDAARGATAPSVARPAVR